MNEDKELSLMDTPWAVIWEIAEGTTYIRYRGLMMPLRTEFIDNADPEEHPGGFYYVFIFGDENNVDVNMDELCLTPRAFDMEDLNLISTDSGVVYRHGRMS